MTSVHADMIWSKAGSVRGCTYGKRWRTPYLLLSERKLRALAAKGVRICCFGCLPQKSANVLKFACYVVLS
jgi:hypothetical protein